MNNRTRHRLWEWLGKLATLVTIVTIAIAIVRYFMIPSLSLQGEFRYDEFRFPEFTNGQFPDFLVQVTEQGLEGPFDPYKTPANSFQLWELRGQWTGYLENTGKAELTKVRLMMPNSSCVRVRREGKPAYFHTSIEPVELGSLQPGERVRITGWEAIVDVFPQGVTPNDDDTRPSWASASSARPWATHSQGIGSIKIVNFGSYMDILQSHEGLTLVILFAGPALISAIATCTVLVFFRRSERGKVKAEIASPE